MGLKVPGVKGNQEELMRNLKLAAALIVICFPVLAIAQQTKVVRGPAKQTSPASGKEMFDEYCATCHGLSGVGNGPAATALTPPPANLTTLSQRNGGVYPEPKVVQAIKAGPGVPAHGSASMPVWGRVFSEMDMKSTEGIVQLRVRNLSEYIKSLQK
jgi:mono/diheme cytochrome c family protein